MSQAHFTNTMYCSTQSLQTCYIAQIDLNILFYPYVEKCSNLIKLTATLQYTALFKSLHRFFSRIWTWTQTGLFYKAELHSLNPFWCFGSLSCWKVMFFLHVSCLKFFYHNSLTFKAIIYFPSTSAPGSGG